VQAYGSFEHFEETKEASANASTHTVDFAMLKRARALTLPPGA